MAAKKMRELMEAHHVRAFVRRRVIKGWSGVTRLEEGRGRDHADMYARE